MADYLDGLVARGIMSPRAAEALMAQQARDVAAQRQQQAVQPAGGRQEGAISQWIDDQGQRISDQLSDLARHPENIVGTGELGPALGMAAPLKGRLGNYWTAGGEGIRTLNRLNNEGRSLDEMASHFGVSKPFIIKTLKQHDIDLRNDTRVGSRDEGAIDSRLREMEAQGMSRAGMARELGLSPGAVTRRFGRMQLRENPESAQGMGQAPSMTDWETGPDGTMVRRSR